jgi:hypothetical protein
LSPRLEAYESGSSKPFSPAHSNAFVAGLNDARLYFLGTQVDMADAGVKEPDDVPVFLLLLPDLLQADRRLLKFDNKISQGYIRPVCAATSLIITSAGRRDSPPREACSVSTGCASSLTHTIGEWGIAGIFPEKPSNGSMHGTRKSRISSIVSGRMSISSSARFSLEHWSGRQAPSLALLGFDLIVGSIQPRREKAGQLVKAFVDLRRCLCSPIGYQGRSPWLVGANC